jgi:hypothetical protein
VLPDLSAVHAEQEYNRKRETITSLIWGNFRSLDAKELDLIEQILDINCVGRLSINDVKFFSQILDINARSVDCTEIELRWAQNIPVDHPSLSEFGIETLQSDEAKNTLRTRIADARDPGAPLTFEEVIDRGLLSLRFLQSPAATDPAALANTLRAIAHPNLKAKVLNLLQGALTPESQLAELSSFLPSFAEALLAALDSISADHEMNRMRVESIRSKTQA